MIEIVTKTPIEEIEKKLNNLDAEKLLQKTLDDLKGSVNETFAIISSGSSYNKTGDETLKYGAFSYIQLENSNSKEKFLFVFNIPFIDAEKIARDYKQESFFFGTAKGNKMQIAHYQINNKTYKRDEISNTIINEKDIKDFFSKYNLEFKLNLDLFNDSSIPLDNEWIFEEELKEPSTFKHRAIERRKIKNNVDEKLLKYFN